MRRIRMAYLRTGFRVIVIATFVLMVVLILVFEGQSKPVPMESSVSVEGDSPVLRPAITTRPRDGESEQMEVVKELSAEEEERRMTGYLHSFNQTLIKAKPMKNILLWNPFFGEPDYGVGWIPRTGWGTAAFERTKCPYTCYTANDHSELDAADAVMIHAFNLGPRGQNITIPKRVSREQIYVFFIIESQLRSEGGFRNAGFGFTDIFNLTFSFLDIPETDIYIPLGGMAKRDKPEELAVPSLETLKQKTKFVAWFVSNCNAPSARLEYARELGKYIQVDMYGECGNLTCELGDGDCFQRIKAEYMFYLAAENSFCEGYATEKLFRTLQTSMIPIVYGGANYSKLLSVKSYINVRDFQSPRHLAHHLIYLKNNPEKHHEYFKWKQHYSVLLEGDFKARGFCKLCTILNTPGYQYKTGYDPVEYWNPTRWCRSREDERMLVHLTDKNQTEQTGEKDGADKSVDEDRKETKLANKFPEKVAKAKAGTPVTKKIVTTRNEISSQKDDKVTKMNENKNKMKRIVNEKLVGKGKKSLK